MQCGPEHLVNGMGAVFKVDKSVLDVSIAVHPENLFYTFFAAAYSSSCINRSNR